MTNAKASAIVGTLKGTPKPARARAKKAAPKVDANTAKVLKAYYQAKAKCGSGAARQALRTKLGFKPLETAAQWAARQ
jgi:hypothetical protein